MITAIVFVQAEVDRIPEVAADIAALAGVTEVYSVTGDIDLVAMVRVREHDQLADVIADRLNKVAGVTSTETHIAFRTYSSHDLESAFDLGAWTSRPPQQPTARRRRELPVCVARSRDRGVSSRHCRESVQARA